MGIPQYIVIFILGLQVITGICCHGKPREGEYNGIEAFLSATITAGILYAGGFWSQ